MTDHLNCSVFHLETKTVAISRTLDSIMWADKCKNGWCDNKQFLNQH